jgi:hypothetical protein
MVIRLYWQEVADIVAKAIKVEGLTLGEPRVMAPAAYGGEEQVENAVLEFPIITAESERPRFVEPVNAALAPGAPALPDDDTPF